MNDANETHQPAIDDTVVDNLVKRFGSDKGKILLGKFMASMDEFSNNLQQAFAARDNITMHRMAHNLKSSCGNVGANRARMLAIEIEEAIEQVMEQEGAIYSDQSSVQLLVKELGAARAYISSRYSA